MDFQHTPVLLSEVLELLDPQPGKIVVAVSYTHLDVYKRQG